MLVSGIPKNTTESHLFEKLYPITSQHMEFRDAGEVGVEILYSNVQPLSAHVAFQKLSGLVFEGSSTPLKVTPIVPSNISLESTILEKFFAAFHITPVEHNQISAHQQEKTIELQKLEKEKRELDFFAQSSNYKDDHNDYVLTNQQFQHRKALLSGDWESPLPTPPTSPGAPWVFVSKAGFWHLSWPRPVPGHKWNAELRQKYEVHLSDVVSPRNPSTQSVFNRLMKMNQIGTLVNLFGGPEVSLSEPLTFLGMDGFTVGLTHPRIELFIPRTSLDASNFARERSRWVKCIQTSISDYFKLDIERVEVELKPKDGELVSRNSIVFVRVKEAEDTITPTTDKTSQVASLLNTLKTTDKRLDTTEGIAHLLFNGTPKTTDTTEETANLVVIPEVLEVENMVRQGIKVDDRVLEEVKRRVRYQREIRKTM